MITYRAIYQFLEDGKVHAEVVDFPGAISFGNDLDDARKMLKSALVDMAETALLLGEALPIPTAAENDLDADLDEPIHLVLTATEKAAPPVESTAALA